MIVSGIEKKIFLSDNFSFLFFLQFYNILLSSHYCDKECFNHAQSLDSLSNPEHYAPARTKVVGDPKNQNNHNTYMRRWLFIDHGYFNWAGIFFVSFLVGLLASTNPTHFLSRDRDPMILI